MSEEMVKVQHLSLADTKSLGAIFVKSGFFLDARDEAQAVVKILAGRELGFGPFASMTGINVIKGKVTLSANLVAAAIKRSGRYNFRVPEHTATSCVIAFFERFDKWEPIGVSPFTMDDAKKAGLSSGANWVNYPRNMLFARALTNGARWYTSDIFGGPVYTPDELGAPIDPETGELVVPTPPDPERTFKRSMARSREREQAVATVPGAAPVRTEFPSDEEAERESRDLFTFPEEKKEREALSKDASRLANKLKLTLEQRLKYMADHNFGGADVKNVDLVSLVEMVNAMRQAAGEQHWGSAA
jgi:hypothetical protein